MIPLNTFFDDYQHDNANMKIEKIKSNLRIKVGWESTDSMQDYFLTDSHQHYMQYGRKNNIFQTADLLKLIRK